MPGSPIPGAPDRSMMLVRPCDQEASMTQGASRPTAGGLGEARVEDVMSAPLVTCLPDVPLREVADLMTRHRIHAVVVGGAVASDEERWGVISELDLVRGARLADPDVPAGRLAATPRVVVGRDESLERAAMLMAEYRVTHLIVVERRHAVGIVSASDVARALAPAAPEAQAGAEPAPEPSLTAAPGDRLVIRAHRLGEPERGAEVLEARGAGGGPPFLVRWEAGGRISLLYPGADARVEAAGGR
jgi:CBS domain-containing protein